MSLKLRHRLVVLCVCLSLLLATVPARAQLAPSGAQAAGIFAVLIGLGVGAGFGIYYLARSPRSLTGCVASSGQNVLQIQGDHDAGGHVLTGDLAGVTSGRRMRVAGRMTAKDARKQRHFAVQRVTKDFGACKVQPATP